MNYWLFTFHLFFFLNTFFRVLSSKKRGSEVCFDQCTYLNYPPQWLNNSKTIFHDNWLKINEIISYLIFSNVRWAFRKDLILPYRIDMCLSMKRFFSMNDLYWTFFNFHSLFGLFKIFHHHVEHFKKNLLLNHLQDHPKHKQHQN